VKKGLAALAVCIAGCGGSSSPAPTPTPALTPTAEAARVAPLCRAAPVAVLGRAENPAVTELSGLVQAADGTFWTHNDSGDSARVFQLDGNGRFLREVAVPGAEAYDWEDIAIRGDELFVGDIGDNLGQRPNITVYRLRPGEPATRIALQYPDRTHDAEALLVDGEELAVVTKDFGGVAGVYTARETGTMRKVAELDLGVGQAVTAGDISADGTTIALRSYGSAWVWERAAGESLEAAFQRPPCVVKAGLIQEGQGETLALSRDGRAFYTVPEGANPPLRRYGG
jgi:hypothetical protein